VKVESGKRDDRPKLAEALALCQLYNATLVIVELDRLSRDMMFLVGLQKAGVQCSSGRSFGQGAAPGGAKR